MCPSITSSVEDKIEEHMRDKFDVILGQPTRDNEWIQACLPTKTHGCGLGRPKDIITAAFAANVEETINAVRTKLPATLEYIALLDAPIDEFDAHEFSSQDIMLFVRSARDKKRIVEEAASSLYESPRLQRYDETLAETKKKTQHFYSDFINRSRAKEVEEMLMDNDNATNKARFHSNDGSFAGAWLFNVPTDKHSTIPSNDFRTALKLRLGIAFHNLLPKCCCKEREPIGTNPFHLFACNEFKPALLWRHNAIQNDLMDIARHGNVRAIDYGLSRMTQNDNRKGDILFPGFGTNGKDLVVDICIANACCKSYAPLSCDTQGHAMSILKSGKVTNT